jgi:hypothetical protein
MHRITCREYLLNELTGKSNERNIIKPITNRVERMEMELLLASRDICTTYILTCFNIKRGKEDVPFEDEYTSNTMDVADWKLIDLYQSLRCRLEDDDYAFDEDFTNLVEVIMLRMSISVFCSGGRLTGKDSPNIKLDNFSDDAHIIDLLIDMRDYDPNGRKVGLVDIKMPSQDVTYIYTYPDSLMCFPFKSKDAENFSNEFSFALVICVCDGYLRVPEGGWIYLDRVRRYYKIMSQLHLDIQLRMFNKTVGSPDWAFAAALTDPKMGISFCSKI